MKLVIGCFLLLYLIAGNAEERVTVSFDSIKLNELAKTSFVEILSYDFISDSEFLKDETAISIHMHDRPLSNIEAQIKSIIDSNGYTVEKIGKLISISKKHKPKTDQKSLYYKFKNRGHVYLVSLLQSSFPNGSFNFQRKIKSSSDTETHQTQPSSDTSALAQIDTNSSDSFIFNGTEDDIYRLNSLLDKIDLPDTQVEIKAYLYEVKVSQFDQSGFNLAMSLLKGKLNLDLGSKLVSNTLNLAIGDLTAAIAIFNSDSRFKLLSSPFLLVKNNEKASFSVGSDVPVIGQFTQNQVGQIVQSVEYKQSGVLFDVVPRIYESTIDLNIHHQISNFISTNTGVNNTPTLIKRELSTTVKTKHADILVLGGLNEKSETDTNSGFKFLPNFLRNKAKEATNSEILLIMSVQKT